MSAEEMFRGFKVSEGKDRFEERIEISGDLAACKVSAQDTHGAMCVFELTGGQCGPRHIHHDQDEWMYIIEGEFDFEIGGQLLRAHPGDTVFLPRKVAHGWTPAGQTRGRVLKLPARWQDGGVLPRGRPIHHHADP
jgi:quercetin dioxygenase-like cupin family protein